MSYRKDLYGCRMKQLKVCKKEYNQIIYDFVEH